MGTLRTNVADHSGVVDARVAAKFLKEERKKNRWSLLYASVTTDNTILT